MQNYVCQIWNWVPGCGHAKAYLDRWPLFNVKSLSIILAHSILKINDRSYPHLYLPTFFSTLPKADPTYCTTDFRVLTTVFDGSRPWSSFKKQSLRFYPTIYIVPSTVRHPPPVGARQLKVRFLFLERMK